MIEISNFYIKKALDIARKLRAIILSGRYFTIQTVGVEMK